MDAHITLGSQDVKNTLKSKDKTFEESVAWKSLAMTDGQALAG